MSKAAGATSTVFMAKRSFRLTSGISQILPIP
jgi:hypothetical protein